MKKLLIIFLVMVFFAGGFFTYIKFFAGKNLPTAAKTLVEEMDNKKILPHVVETNTYFEEAIDYLVEDAAPPSILSDESVGAPSQMPAIKPKPGSESGLEIALPESDWNGLVLVPDMKLMSKAYSSSVSLPRVEAHPLQNNRIRVWARIQNETQGRLRLQVGCTFRIEGSLDHQQSKSQFLTLAKGTYQDVMFNSPSEGVMSYTVLVK
jgi:hypothetical protein